MILLASCRALIAQSVERILGKDEVSSSNLDKSSIRKAPKSLRFGGFFFLYGMLVEAV